MPVKSSVRKLEPAIRAEVDRLLGEGRFSLDDVVAHLRTLGAEVSRSALGRYSQKIEKVQAKLRETREITSSLSRELGDLAAGDAGRVMTELLHALVFKVAMAKSEEDAQVKPMDIMLLAKAIKDLAGGSKISADLEMQIKERAAKEARETAATAATKAAKKAGVSAETLDLIRREILGIGQ